MSTKGSPHERPAAARRVVVRLALLCAIGAGLTLSGWAARLTIRVEAAGGQAQGPAQGPAANGISPEALAQIEALLREKQGCQRHLLVRRHERDNDAPAVTRSPLAVPFSRTTRPGRVIAVSR